MANSVCEKCGEAKENPKAALCDACQSKFNCKKCGSTKEDPRTESCYSCHLISLVPPKHQQKEDYYFDPDEKVSRARLNPKTGVPILDLHHPLIAEMVAHMTEHELARRMEIEAMDPGSGAIPQKAPGTCQLCSREAKVERYTDNWGESLLLCPECLRIEKKGDRQARKK